MALGDIMKMYCKNCYMKINGKDWEKIKLEMSYENRICENCGKSAKIVVNVYKGNRIFK